MGVQVTGAYRNLNAGPNTVTQQISSSVTESTGGTHALALNYLYATDLFIYDPATGTTFTRTAVNSPVAGYKLAG